MSTDASFDSPQFATGPLTAIAGAVGKTPLLHLDRYSQDLPADVYVKLEQMNPGGSVKDRIGVSMIVAAEREGNLAPGQTVVEPTSGNTGIALAMVCAARGYPLVLTLPEGMSRERARLLRAYGAEVHETPSLGGMNEAVSFAERLVAERDGYMPLQFANAANPEAHHAGTAPEIWEAVQGELDAFVAGVGTGGTITGVARFLKERGSQARIVAVEPANSQVLGGGKPGPHKIQGIGAGFVPEVLDRSVIDEVIAVEDETAIVTAEDAARTQGVLGGISAGANIWAAREVASRPHMEGRKVVTVVCDSGERYMSLPFFAQ